MSAMVKTNFENISKQDENEIEKELNDIIFGQEFVFNQGQENNSELKAQISIQNGFKREALPAEIPEIQENHNDMFFIDTGNEPNSPESVSAETLFPADNLAMKLAGGEKINHANNNMQKIHDDPKRPWVDEFDDMDQIIDLNQYSRLKKLKLNFQESNINSKELEERLRSRFVKINPQPKWAELPVAENEKSDQIELADSTKPLIVPTICLNPEKIHIVRVKDANFVDPSPKATLRCVSFHPTAPVLLTAGLDKYLRIFQIDGKNNPQVQSYLFKDLPIHSAIFSHLEGDSMIMTGRRNYIYSLDLLSGKTSKTIGIRGRDEKSFERSFIAPCNNYIIVLGRDGYILILSMISKQCIGQLKMNTGVVDIAFGPNGQLWSLGVDATINVWNVEDRSCVFKFSDQGSNKGTALSLSPNGEYVAIGSSSGVVNLYNVADTLLSFNPEPIKVFMNLTTSISSLLFHPSSQILVMGCKTLKDSLRMIHIGSRKVFQNWPTAKTPLGHVMDVSFSPDGQFLAVGNDKGKVLLYRIEAFAKFS